jgi:membrane-associated protein
VGPIEQALEILVALPPWLIYVILALGAATESLFPPVPADVFAIAGGAVAAHGAVRPWAVFLVTWLPNVTAAVGVYWLARRHGARFFKMPLARWLLREHQLESMAHFYRRWGVPAIALGRFLPGWRAVVPVFAGFARMSARRVVPTFLIASAIWHGLLVQAGLVAGRNLDLIGAILAGAGRVLLVIGLALAVMLVAWWWHTRHPDARP